jgi:hypothetical protein
VMPTIRYRATTNIPYAMGIVELFRYARAHPVPDFTFGPFDLKALESQGLLVSGPDLTGVADLLEGVPGLAEVPA